ncbi:hypothetical protein [Halalkalibacterium ligniniphilum]|uniref:hypothetical protein n=1 Tax=Halalkalibacterium ligniniphilum TaxID=1134413 RepID=UPI0003484C1B|nr:hypothetical protein [Halalkalibacterium ligniniphilum]
MKLLQEWPFFHVFVPSHRKPVDSHILGDEASRKLISDTEALLNKMVNQSLGQNQRKTVRRKHKERRIIVKINQKRIRVIMMDTKFSSAAVQKRMFIECFRKYVKAKDGVGKCKEASIHYLKDGRSHVRSIRQSPLLHGVFFQINRLDEAYLGHRSNAEQSVSALTMQHQERAAASQNDMRLLHQETERFIRQLRPFSLDPLLENRLSRIVDQTEKLIPDFELLDFEERHTVRRMLREDIPNLLNTYLSLSYQHQLAQKENVFVALSKMELSLISLNEQLEQSRVERMEHLLRLNQLRYDK